MLKRSVLLSLLFVPWLALPLPAAEPSSEGNDFFEKKIRPLFVEHCYKCHSATAKKLRGGLRLDSRADLLKGGESGPVVVPGQPEKSRLIEAVAYTNVELQMPPRGKLPAGALADLSKWVRMGAPWPKQPATNHARPASVTFDLAERKRTHWAWQPIRPRMPPDVRDTGWPRSSVDRFILSRLEQQGLAPAKPADKRTLLRRLYFDLIGLPPFPAEVEAFLHDTSTDALERVVDRLLSSPQFGERWARHWLDLVRYAETRGHEFDYPIPNAYQYRDYVIRALNADVPYNQFVLEHLAGDLLTLPRLHPQQGFNESILGTAFWFLGEEVHSPVDVRQDQADRFDNKVDVLSKAFLGLTVACARCHDHKFDAITTKDYYALFGFLQSSHYRLARFDSMEQNRRVAEQLWETRASGRQAVQKALAEALRPGAELLAKYLLAAREAMRLPTCTPRRVFEIARSHKLDAMLLIDWIAHLNVAAGDVHDPFHSWAKVAVDPLADDPKHLGELLHSLAKSAGQHTDAEAIETILDYAQCSPAQWLPDGFAFGPGPVRPGQLLIRGETTKPVLRFSEDPAAQSDPTWNVLKIAPGTENDPGALGAVVRAGRTLRTPTFLLTTGKVFYRVKGSGLVYAAVGSHVMIAGPLHGQLVRTVNTGDRFQWIAHDLTAYQGQRVHLEFTPAGNAPFAVAQIVQGKNAPATPDGLNPATLPILSQAASLETLAHAYQHLVLDTLHEIATDRLVSSREARPRAQLMNWLLEHAELFGSVTPGGKVARNYLFQQSEITARIQPESRLCVALIDGSPEDEYVFIRGSHKARGETVPRRFLEALAGPAKLNVSHGSGRLELARQVIDPELDPFLPRVIVNRVWHHLFGRGIVASTDNFGVLGERPSHPELLDYLAERFVKEGWSVKRLIRQLVLSSAYRMDSQADEAAERADPDDVLLHRMRRRRLEGEAIRDAMLSLSESLDRRMYGPSVLVHLTEFQEGRGRPASGPLDGAGRRSLYLSVRRNFLSPFLLAFDTPSPFSTVGRRTVSNVPAQSLILLNDPFVHQQAQRWAKKICSEQQSEEARIIRMYESAFTRPPTEVESSACRAFLHQYKIGEQATGQDDLAAWTDLAHVLLNVKEFIFLN